MTTIPSLAYMSYLCAQGTREDPRKGVLVDEHGAMVLVGDVEVLREGTAGHEASCRHPRLEATGPLVAS